MSSVRSIAGQIIAHHSPPNKRLGLTAFKQTAAGADRVSKDIFFRSYPRFIKPIFPNSIGGGRQDGFRLARS